MPRSPKQPILYQEKLKVPEEFLRFATPKEVAIHRAERLKCDTIVEIGAGIGGQTFAFAKKCQKVLAIEKNKKYAGQLINNLKKMNIENVKVIIGDALSPDIIEKIRGEKPEIIFCDSERKAEGERIIEEFQPNIKELLEKYYSLTKNIAIEIPPFTSNLSQELKKEDYEKEFLSLNKKLNRLTLYFNSLKKCDASVVLLPEKEKIELNDNEKAKKAKKVNSAKKFEYLYEINPAVILAGIADKLADRFKLSLFNINDKPFLISKDLINSAFLQAYRILNVTNSSKESILRVLKKEKVGKVILRYPVKPEEYWKIRNSLEEELEKNGKEARLFFNEKKDEMIICEKT